MPRILELMIVIPALIILFPVYILLALLIMLSSPGNPFFLQPRVGKNGQIFQMIKFRKMARHESRDGIGVTTMHDKRLTLIGKFLVRFKMDELPQFINVLKGDMALIGPRPEIEKFTKFYPEKWDTVLSVKPGILGYAQIVCPHEEELYPDDCADPEMFYVSNILPEKLDREIEYIQRKSTIFDLGIFIRVSIIFLLNGMRLKLKWAYTNTFNMLVPQK